MSTFEQLFTPGLKSYAFNKSKNQVAISDNSKNVYIYERKGGNFELIDTLIQHDEMVTCVDWAPNSNKLVSCGQDRNAYVWEHSEAGWKPTLVVLRINRAATFVRWSPNEDKFAVASGAKCVSICYFEEDNDWWVSKILKKPLRSTALGLDWHPNNVLLAVGSADMRAYVLSAFIKGVDKKPPPSPWGDKLPFNTVCAEYTTSTGGWVHSVAFSPSGDALAFSTHGSLVVVAYPASKKTHEVNTSLLPFTSLVWIGEGRLIAAGFDCRPYLLEGGENQGWALGDTIDVNRAALKSPGVGGSAFAMFRQMDSQAIKGTGAHRSDTVLTSVHQNTISMVRALHDNAGHIVTGGLDGRLVLWKV